MRTEKKWKQHSPKLIPKLKPAFRQGEMKVKGTKQCCLFTKITYFQNNNEKVRAYKEALFNGVDLAYLSLFRA